MTRRPPEPSDADGPLFRETYRRADAVDRADTPERRRGAWARLVPSVLAAFAEGFLRDELMVGAVLFSIITAVIGATSGDPVWATGCVAAGVIGTVLVLLAWRRRWSFGRQWAVILSVLLLQIAVIVAFWQTR